MLPRQLGKSLLGKMLCKITFQNFACSFQLSLSRQLGKSLLGSSGGQELGNELSAPYEVPQFPIEQIESKIRR